MSIARRLKDLADEVGDLEEEYEHGIRRAQKIVDLWDDLVHATKGECVGITLSPDAAPIAVVTSLPGGGFNLPNVEKILLELLNA